MTGWQAIETAPMHTPILVVFHGGGENMIQIVRRIEKTGQWGDFDYINSHYGEPKYWRPASDIAEMSSYPMTVPNDMAGPDCGCDGCTEEYHGRDDV